HPLTRTRIATAAALRTAKGPQATAAPMGPAAPIRTARARPTPTSTAAAPRIATMVVPPTPTPMAVPRQARPAMVRPTRTPMAARHQARTETARSTPLHTDRPPTPRRTIHPRHTIRIIRPPQWATTEQAATTAVRLRAPPPWALRSAWLPVQPSPPPRLPRKVQQPLRTLTLRATTQAQ